MSIQRSNGRMDTRNGDESFLFLISSWHGLPARVGDIELKKFPKNKILFAPAPHHGLEVRAIVSSRDPQRSINTSNAGRMKTAPNSAPANPSEPTMEKSRSARMDANTMAMNPTTLVTHAATSAPPMVWSVASAASAGLAPAVRRSR